MAGDVGDKKSLVETILKLFVAEFVGTAILLFIGCMGCAFDPKHLFPGFSPALTFGLAVMICVQIFMHISGCHINPVITIAVMIFGAMKPLIGLVYIVAQVLGATFGFGLLKLLLSDKYVDIKIPVSANVTIEHPLCLNTPNPSLASYQVVGIEAVTSAILILILCGITDKKNHHNTDSIALRFGLAITGLASGSAQFTGGSMNPARSFAPALLHGIWTQHWIYWVGPILGAVIGSFFYKLLYFSPPEQASAEELRSLDTGDNGAKA